MSRYGNSWKRCYAARHKMQNGWEGGRPGDFKMTPLRAHKNYVSAFDYYRNNVVSGSADSSLQVRSLRVRGVCGVCGVCGVRCVRCVRYVDIS